MGNLMTLFTTFLRIGAFTFGGGYAMIPLIETEAVEKRGWVTHEDVLDMIAIAEATPGVLAVNSATFIGYRVAGFWGSLLATVGVALPSFLVILIVAAFLWQFRDNQYVAYAFMGIRAAVVALMVNAVVKLAKHVPKLWRNAAIFACAFVLATFTEISVIWILLAAAVTGVGLNLAAALPKKGGKAK